MKTPNLFCRLVCCLLTVLLALPASTWAQLTLVGPEFPSSNIVRLTLSGAQTNAAYLILTTPTLEVALPGWQRVATGAVGQVQFDLSLGTNPAAYFAASDVPNPTPTVATPVLSPGGGSHPWPTNVTITCATEGAAIYYTTSGSTPTTLDSFIYNGGSVAVAGSVTLKAKAFKAGYNDSAVASATYTINAGPVVSAGAQQIITGSSTTLAGYVMDDGLTGGGTRYTSWSKASGPGSVTFNNASQTNTTATFGTDGIYVLQLAASDGQYTNSSLVTIAVNPTLLVSITAPTNGAGFTVPTNILLQATASSSSGSVTQLLFYADATLVGTATADALGFSHEWRSVPAGTHALRAVAVSSDVNNFSLASDPVSITVAWPTNVGQVTLALADLQIPVAGLAIAVNRMFDTRWGTTNSFGANWRLDWEEPRIEKSGSFVDGWVGTASGGNYCIAEDDLHLVTVRMSESEQYYFRPVIVRTINGSPCKFGQPPNYINETVRFDFEPVGGSLGELSATDPAFDVGMDDLGGGWAGVVVPSELDDFGLLVGPYEPDLSQLVFTGTDGTRYGFGSDGRLASRTDRNGNALYYSASSIYHTSGRQVTFTRDAENRITEIYDPIAQASSGSPALKYDYSPNGNLTNVARLIQRSPAVYENTAYAYTNTSFPHHLTSIKDARGIVSQRYEYDTSGRLVKQYDALNRATSYTYDLANHRQTVTDRLTNATLQTFTGSGQLASVQDPNNGVTSYGYDARGRRVTETNPQGQSTSYAYDERDQLTGVTNEIGNGTSATYNDFGQVLVALDARGNGTTNEYDANGNLIFVTNALVIVSTYGYDAQGNRTAETNALGLAEQVIVLNDFDAYGYLLTNRTFNAQLSTLNSVSYTYDENGNRRMETRSRTTSGGTETLVTEWTYDAANRVISTIDPLGFTNRVVYDPLGKQAQTIDKLGRTNANAYDAVGLLTNTTFADGLNERFAYDAEGRRVQSVDRSGRANVYTFDRLGRLARTTYPDGSYVQNSYDGVGRLTRISQGAPPPGGDLPPQAELVTRYGYDAAGRRRAVTNALGQVTRFAYDANGNQTNVVDALNRTNRFDFDALNRQTKLTYPDGTSESYRYDALDRRITVTNQAGIVTRFGFDALGRLVAVTNAFGSGQQMVTRYEFDEVGNLLSQIDALSHTNRYEYDGLGRRTRHTLPAGQVATFGYDAVANLIRETNFNGAVLTNQYDALNRLTNKASVGSYKVTFAYSPTGQRTNMVDGTGTNTYAYDNRDRLLTKATPQGMLTYTYDGFGNLATIQSSTTNGTKLNYYYDDLNRLTNVTDRFTNSTAYSFDSVGNLQTVRYPISVTNTWTYNALNRLTNISVTTASGTIASFAYKLAPAGNRTNLVENLNGSWRTNAWSYDPLYRLTNEVISGASPTGTISYQYDAVGNRTNRTSTVSGVTNQTFSYNANDQLTTDVYDANGNTRTNGSNTYAYDVENRLTNYNNGAATYLYDGDGNRVRKTVSGTNTYYLVDDRNHTGHAQVLEELTTIGSTPDRLYTYGLDLVSQRQSNGTIHYYGYDGNGNVRFLTATNATVSDTYVYDAFGNLLTSTGSTANNYRYTGEQYDPNLGFYYLRARYLNPNSGRFMSRDSYAGNIYDPASLHKYLYAQNDPVDNTDPSGQFTLVQLTIVIALTAIVVYVAFQGYKKVVKPVGRQLAATPMNSTQVDAAVAALRPYQDLNPKIGLLISAIEDERIHILVSEGTGGAHNQAVKGTLFISKDVLNQKDDFAVGVVIFAEFQHDAASNAVLGEDEAQKEWVVLREAIRKRSPKAITPYIDSLIHGGRR